MQERGYSIDLDTSLKKYPLDKYYNSHELAHLSTNIFQNRTIEYATKSRPSSKKVTLRLEMLWHIEILSPM